MRWDSLFDDLESQLERELGAEEIDVEIEEERLRLARLGLRDRLVALGPHPVVLVLDGGERVTARLADIGRDWVAVDAAGPPAWSGIVPLAAVAAVAVPPGAIGGSLGSAAAGHPSLTERLGLPFVLRDLCRRRRYVRLDMAAGMLGGTIDRVGRDHLDLAVHPPDSPRRESAVSEVRLVPLDRLRLIRLT